MENLAYLVGVARADPLILLTFCAVAFGAYQSWELRKERNISRSLVQDILLAKEGGYEPSEETERTIVVHNLKRKASRDTKKGRR